MILQTLDVQDNCSGIYYNGEFYFENFPNHEQVQNAWKSSPILDREKETYLYILSRGRPLLEYSKNRESFERCILNLNAQSKAAATAKINLKEVCLFDIIPEKRILDWFKLRDEALRNILKTEKKTEDYDILHKIHVLVESMNTNSITFSEKQKRIKYNMFGSATGRLTTVKGSLPILSLKKDQRCKIRPKNDLFLELDLNGAEIRTLLSLSGTDQPDIDIHEFNRSLSTQNLSRSAAKDRFFAWLYNPEAKDEHLEKLYNKDIYKEHYKDGFIATPFGRRIQVEERKALNYLLQSTTSDLVLESAYNIMNFLKGAKSRVAFTVHDSVVVDFSKEDIAKVTQLKEIFEKNKLGKYLSKIQIGKNFSDMKEVSF